MSSTEQPDLPLLWEPVQERWESSPLAKFQRMVNRKYSLNLRERENNYSIRNAGNDCADCFACVLQRPTKNCTSGPSTTARNSGRTSSLSAPSEPSLHLPTSSLSVDLALLRPGQSSRSTCQSGSQELRSTTPKTSSTPSTLPTPRHATPQRRAAGLMRMPTRSSKCPRAGHPPLLLPNFARHLGAPYENASRHSLQLCAQKASRGRTA